MSSQVAVDDDAKGRIVRAIRSGADLEVVSQEVRRSSPHDANAHRVAKTPKQRCMPGQAGFPLHPTLAPTSISFCEVRVQQLLQDGYL
eukprot:CAMPEP_0204026450 /NCGR_PEP_ID=MMETSP0360-20130528/46059_1 /ASSEMBLY_ACC=CAM_ASM_000342 /TAXON_ID=268821 /ORGANISM="Scrippsiella Hangoei, Strain SHTV-5" /LENGTH=87 /DNA_ID=CAMNT_0050970083 /DNA_START=75 /DNA_END=335 /DNA_ORIENTATION=-